MPAITRYFLCVLDKSHGGNSGIVSQVILRPDPFTYYIPLASIRRGRAREISQDSLNCRYIDVTLSTQQRNDRSPESGVHEERKSFVQSVHDCGFVQNRQSVTGVLGGTDPHPFPFNDERRRRGGKNSSLEQAIESNFVRHLQLVARLAPPYHIHPRSNKGSTFRRASKLLSALTLEEVKSRTSG